MVGKDTKNQIAKPNLWTTKQWEKLLAATRPNNNYINLPNVLSLLQHLSDGINEVMMARPLQPLSWLADYLRRVCKHVNKIENDPVDVLIIEMHKKRRIIQHTLNDIKARQQSNKHLIQKIQAQEENLHLLKDEILLKIDDRNLLYTETKFSQRHWSINPSMLDIDTPTISQEEEQRLLDQILEHCLAKRDINSYFHFFMKQVTKSLVRLQLAAPTDPVSCLISFLYQESQFETYDQASAKVHSDLPWRSETASPTLRLYLRMNSELQQRVLTIKKQCASALAQQGRLEEIINALQSMINRRDFYIQKLLNPMFTNQVPVDLEGKVMRLNNRQYLIPLEHVLHPHSLDLADQKALVRAEAELMHRDETTLKIWLKNLREMYAATSIQAKWRGFRKKNWYMEILNNRHKNAKIIQRNYLAYLYCRATKLPSWCVLGREVIVAPSVAQRCAINFEFYPMKDFPYGDNRRVNMSISELKSICRHDEDCAGFSSLGALKRFIPRQISQLRPMIIPPSAINSGEDHGLYVKRYPSRSTKIINSGIITAVPKDRFGMVEVAMDGLDLTEAVPISNTYERWKRIRIKKDLTVAQTKRPKRKTVVFGNDTKNTFDFTEKQASVDLYEIVEEDDDEAEIKAQWKARGRKLDNDALPLSNIREQLTLDTMQQNSKRAKETVSLIKAKFEWQYIYEDQVTKEISNIEPNNTYGDATVRKEVIAARRREYLKNAQEAQVKKELASIIRMQCAWRSKVARDKFRNIFDLRAEEIKHEQAINQVKEVHTKKNARKLVKEELRRSKEEGNKRKKEKFKRKVSKHWELMSSWMNNKKSFL